MKNSKQYLRISVFCLITVIAASWSGMSHARLGDRFKAAAHKTSKVVVHRASKAANKAGKTVRRTASKIKNKLDEVNPAKLVHEATDGIKDKVEDIAQKLNSLSAPMQGSQELVNVIKNGRLISDMQEILLFISQRQADYERFANAGIYVFTDDLNTVIDDLGQMGSLVKMKELQQRLATTRELIQSMPPQFLYVLDKAMGKMLAEIKIEVEAMNKQLDLVRNLPPAIELLKHPLDHEAEICPLVEHGATRVTYAMLMARLKILNIKLDAANELMPDSVLINVNVLGGAGTNIPFPAKPVSQIIKLIGESVELWLETSKDMAEIVCS